MGQLHIEANSANCSGVRRYTTGTGSHDLDSRVKNIIQAYSILEQHAAVFRVRNTLAAPIHKFFQDRGLPLRPHACHIRL